MDDLYQNLLHHQSDVVWCLELEPEPRFLFVNDACRAVLGHPPEAFLEDVALWFRMVHRADVALLGVGDDAETDEPVEGSSDEGGVTVRFFRPDGEQRWAEVRLRRSEEAGRIRLFGVTRDITDRMSEIEQERRLSRRLVEAEALAGVGTYDWDVRRDHMWFSTNLYRIFGRDPETWEPSYAALEAMMLPKHRENASAALAHAAETGTDFADDFEILRPDGAVRTLDVVALVERDNDDRLARVHGVMKDITTEKADETARLLFLADIAHELRTPVAGVIGSAVTLRRQLLDPEPGVASVLDVLDRQAERLRGLSASLVELSSLERRIGVPELAAVELDEAVSRALANEVAPDDLVLDVDTAGLAVLAEPWRLGRILENLLSNAYRYADRRVSVRAAARDDGIVLTVTDDGPGVDPADVETLFSEFHRGVGETGQGSGLGLALVRRLAQTMRAEVVYREAPDGGACFVVRLRSPAS